MDMTSYQQLGKTSYRDTLKLLENDVQHANSLAAAIPKANGGAHLQMKLVYNHFAPFFLFFLRWIDCSCSCFLPRCLDLAYVLVYKVYTDGRPKLSTSGRKASIKEFYAMILPSLEQLHQEMVEDEGTSSSNENLVVKNKNINKNKSKGKNKKIVEDDGEIVNIDSDRDDECGICLETCAKVVLPTCCHAMCIKCFRDWSTRSESCPFCRGSLRRVNSSDLWVLTSKDEVVDHETVFKEDSGRLYHYIRKLPKDSSDVLFLMYYEYLI